MASREAQPKSPAVEVTLSPASVADTLVASAVSVPTHPVAAKSMPPQTEALAASVVPNVDSVVPRAASKTKIRVILGVLWVVTAAIPAVIVWLTMRMPVAPAVQKREVSPRSNPSVQDMTPRLAPVQSAIAVAPKPADTAAVAAAPASATQAAASSIASAPSPASSVPVVVETESLDRVSVLVKSRPSNAKIYRRGKEIGKTPLMIQIGRGEHRIFEVGFTIAGSRRVSIDGEKPEVRVDVPTGVPPSASAKPESLPAAAAFP